ncbi:hypothetical protein WMF11_22785 [Sorangium sp. So ce295]|uniref:hypothetical protein n=1 Tax=Sorangium sp. So ce295 TaxID=3133295 RepID=UPI003F61A02A
MLQLDVERDDVKALQDAVVGEEPLELCALAAADVPRQEEAVPFARLEELAPQPREGRQMTPLPTGMVVCT